MKTFEDEMREQPQALRDTVNYYTDPDRGGKILGLCRRKYEKQRYGQIIFTGMGSSFADGMLGQYFLSGEGIPCRAVDSGELLHYFSFQKHSGYNTPLIVAISQSGESGELVELVKRLNAEKNNPASLWAITNFPESTLGTAAEITLPLMAGEENTVTSKTYVCGLLVTWFLARALSGKAEINTETANLLEDLLHWVGEIYLPPLPNNDGYAERIDSHFGEIAHLHFLGQGTSLTTVRQATLNIKELAKINAEGLSIGMFRHGAQEIIDGSFRAIITISDEAGARSADQLIEKILHKWGGEGRVALITNCPGLHPEYDKEKVCLIVNPVKNPYLAPVYEIMAVQGYLCRIAKKKGLVPGEFRFTQKITR